MRKYFIRRGEFWNQYDLAYAENAQECAALEAIGFTRESRKHAEHDARVERDRRKYDQAFSGYADDIIYPAMYYVIWKNADPCEAETWLWRNYERRGLYMEK